MSLFVFLIIRIISNRFKCELGNDNIYAQQRVVFKARLQLSFPKIMAPNWLIDGRTVSPSLLQTKCIFYRCYYLFVMSSLQVVTLYGKLSRLKFTGTR